MAEDEPPVLVLGVGNTLRGDDGIGVTVARALRERDVPAGVVVGEHDGGTTALLEAWEGHDTVVLVDAMRSGAAPGTVRRLDAGDRPLPAGIATPASSHASGLGEAIELARVLGRLPARVVVYAVEGRRFGFGDPLSPEVAAEVPALADRVLREALRPGDSPRPGPRR